MPKGQGLAFFRRPISQNQPLHNVAHTHFRYSAVAVLTDGSPVEGDSVNLGTTVLRGTAPQGRMGGIPCEEIETVRFER